MARQWLTRNWLTCRSCDVTVPADLTEDQPGPGQTICNSCASKPDDRSRVSVRMAVVDNRERW
jgi:hypothetical protein